MQFQLRSRFIGKDKVFDFNFEGKALADGCERDNDPAFLAQFGHHALRLPQRCHREHER